MAKGKVTKTERINVYMSPEMIEKIKAKADSLGIAVSNLMMVAIVDYMKQDDALQAMKQIKVFEPMRQAEKEE